MVKSCGCGGPDAVESDPCVCDPLDWDSMVKEFQANADKAMLDVITEWLRENGYSV